MISLIKVGEKSNNSAKELVGLSTDTKPDDSTIQNGSLFLEMDTKKSLFGMVTQPAQS